MADRDEGFDRCEPRGITHYELSSCPLCFASPTVPATDPVIGHGDLDDGVSASTGRISPAGGVPSPYRTLSRAEWAGLREDAPLALDQSEIERLLGFNERPSIKDIADVFQPLSRLLQIHAHGVQELSAAVQGFLGVTDRKGPFIIGLGGSVAVGKSTTARILQTLLARWPNSPTVSLVPTDGFLYPNTVLESRGLMRRKGFPESYDLRGLINFLHRVKAGEIGVLAPVYSHLYYDILPDRVVNIGQPDILIVEGLNVLQRAIRPGSGPGFPFVSDFFDFSIYVDADVDIIERWYIERFLNLRATAFRDPDAYFHRYSVLSEEDVVETARDVWTNINRVNLVENILPTRECADLILVKGPTHRIEQIRLRRW